MPDFDIDFCQERRDEVGSTSATNTEPTGRAHNCTRSLLGSGGCARRRRVLQMPLGLVDRNRKLIQTPGKTVSLADAWRTEPRLQAFVEQEPLAAQLFSIVEKIEGLYSP